MADGTWARFRRRASARAGLGAIGVFAAVALLSPLLATDLPLLASDRSGLHCPALGRYPLIGRFFARAPSGESRVLLRALVVHSPYAIALSERLEAPSRSHWLGTDDLGRDVLARLIAAAPVSLSIGFVSASASMILGLLLGGLAGAAGGLADLVVSRVMEIVLCFPAIFFLLALVALWGPSVATIVVAIALTSWPNEARFARAEILKAKELDSTRAARAAGLSRLQIFRSHLLPSAMGPVLISATFGVASATLAEASLSFLGLGVPPPQPSWGGVLALSEAYAEQAWWLALFPGLAIFAAVAAYNLVGDAWRDALDPRLEILPGGLFRRSRAAPGEEIT
jgi:peptide/nickel transport system permease protein